MLMKSDRQIMNELAIGSSYLHELSESDSKALKALLLSMYQDIAALCDKYHLVYMMGGGTCLGAIRHHGYIPWDDDLDMMMPRDSYETLLKLLADGNLGEQYEYAAPNKKSESKNPFLKIYRKGTLDIEIISETVPGPKGVFIDVFPMDYAPKNKVVRCVKGVLSEVLKAICTCVLYKEYPSKRYMEFMRQSPEGLKRYKQRIFIGKVFGIIPHRKWVWWFDQFNSCTKNTGFLTIPIGRKKYMGECRNTDVYLPVVKAEFEGLDVYVPHRVDEYLSSMYSNYMEIPPIDKRERHFVYKFKLLDK